MLSLDQPFLLFDDARQSEASQARYYHQLVDEIRLDSAVDMISLDTKMRHALNQGYHIAGYLSYEAGLLLEERTAPLYRNTSQSLGWFGIFDGYDRLEDSHILLNDYMHADSKIEHFKPELEKPQYVQAFDTIQDYIRSGDIYQANLTFRTHGDFTGDALSLYKHIRQNAAAGYGGILHGGGQTLLSFSPELFFTLKDGALTARPMKGTTKTNNDKVANEQAKKWLQNDPKQRSENLMIVDLLRNDLSKICEPSSVNVPSLFHVETYPTVHQMTSTVRGLLYADKDAVDVIKQIFPCGSITGAPKIRAMEIIDAIEKSPRGSYCGSMGWIEPSGDAAFNVNIRSLLIDNAHQKFSLGIGSGIVADSNAQDEWAECLAKAAFIMDDH